MSQRPLSTATTAATAATIHSSRLGSIRVRVAVAVVFVSLLLVGATDALHLRYQLQQRLQAFDADLRALPQLYAQPLARSLVDAASSDAGPSEPSDTTRQLLGKVQARPGIIGVELDMGNGSRLSLGDFSTASRADMRQIDFKLGPPAADGALVRVVAQPEALQYMFWREQLPAVLWRDLILVLLLSLVLVIVLDRMLLRPLKALRRLASHADAFDPTLPPPEPEPQQPNELARISHSITRAQQSLWLQLQEEQGRAELLRLEVGRQQDALRSAEQSLAQKNLELGRLSRVDELTGLANRREFDEGLRREFKRAQRQRGHLALAVLDLDHFKSFNERYGVAAGDAVLTRFAQLLSVRFKRDTDLVARLGGEEFVALLPGFGLGVTQGLLEQLREDLRELQLPHEGSVNGQVLTVSIGLAAYSPAHPYLSPQALMQAADEALYIAKHAGRDRLSLAASSGHPEPRQG
ncbi:GGDEF domain-containing protein [Roseateles oligotrophus]|uniref:diguanylate cyclase n=1 Tax=Roseateles oligotrophus TaxID=1769250 RepID=A0ABT2YKV8_9BURK|nr:GGDEF domain-containing protein [Roseateles oligotrophus]MCV2370682.1 GGDEF domain-containing protein [Roseateles oligotrophus]